ncbi:hypothetical protein AB0D71_33680 [Streptomyces avermitilis]|uniref:hypothetical protein n=1 Tax=Streptomyces avermitilis TaxID=33903 RepID=UPI0033DA689B
MDAVSGQQQGTGCGGGTLTLLLDGQGVRQAVVVDAWAWGGMEAAGGLQEAGRALVAPMATTIAVFGSRVMVT